MEPSGTRAETLPDPPSGECCRWVTDGVLLMVDIPGFTALSEALTREGPRGMEQLARWLEIFLQRGFLLIQEAGGIPLKYGGDALIAAFHGPEGMQRAEKAARLLLQELPAALSTDQHPELSPPRVVITRGAWLETPMGDHLWQDGFIEGPAVRRLMQLEARAEPGTIHRDVVPPILPGRDFPLSGEAPPAPLSAPLRTRKQPRIQICEEHRVASVVFLQLYRYRTWPPDLDLLRQTVAHVARVVRARGGTLTRLFPHRRGQHLLLLFGVPEAGEDDPYRAVRTALELVQEVEYPRYVRAGVASGRVMAGRLQMGPIEEFTVLGDVVNVAARLMERARRREVCVEEATRARTLEQVRYQPLARLNLKGKRVRTPVYRAIQLLPSQTWYAHPLVGREQERKQLQRAVISGKVIAVLGPPGIGKTRLVQELARMEDVKNRTLLRVRVEGPGLHLFRDLVWTRAGIQPEMSPSERKTRLVRAFQQMKIRHAAAYAAFLERVYQHPSPDALPTIEDPRHRFERLQEILRLVIASLQHTVWVVEDLHRAGPDDLALLHDLLRGKPSSLSVVLVFRGRELPEVLRPVVQETLVLEALPRSSLEEMVRRQKLDGATLDPLARAVLWNLSRGNPLLALAYVREAMARSWIRLHGGVWTLVHAGGRDALPDDLFAVVLAQVDRLGQDIRSVLQAAAVMGQTFPLWLLDALLNRDTRPALQEAEREGLVHLHTEEGWGRFVHELFREVLLRSLPEERRRKLHAAVARQSAHAHARGQTLSPAFVAEQLMLAGEEERALPYALEAGHRARQAFQNREAETWYDRVLKITETRTHPRALRFHAEALWGLAQVAYATGQYTKARTWLEQYLRLHPRGRDRARVRALLAAVLLRLGETDPAETLARNLCRARAPEARMDGWNLLGQIALFREEPLQALKAYRRGLDIAETAGDTLRKARFLHNIGITYQRLPGGEHPALVYLSRALTVFQTVDDPVALLLAWNNLSLTLVPLGRFREAEAALRTGRTLAEQLPHRLGKALTAYNLGALLALRGYYREAYPWLTEAREAFAAMGHVPHLFRTLRDLVQWAWALGDLETADRWLQEVKTLAPTLPRTAWIEDLRLEHAVHAMELQGASPPTALLHWLERLSPDAPVHQLLRAVRACEHTGQHNRARVYLNWALQRARQEGWLSWISAELARLERSEDSRELAWGGRRLLMEARKRDWLSLEWKARYILHRARRTGRTRRALRVALERQLRHIPPSHRARYMRRVHRSTRGLLD